jgi:hypothetical protein
MTSLEEYLTADELEFVKELGVSEIRVIQRDCHRLREIFETNNT